MNYIVLIIALIIASYTDIKSRTIPLWLFPSTFVISIIIDTIFPLYLSLGSKCLGLICMLILFSIASFFGGGGGDIIMMGTLGWILGLKYALYISFIAYVIYSIILIIIKLRNTSVTKKTVLPFAPFALVGTVSVIVCCATNLFYII